MNFSRFLLIVVCAFAFLAPIQPAQADLIGFFFPSLRKDEPDPSDTLQAPFADQEAQETNPIDKGQLPENALALEKAHRDSASISEWLVTVSSEAMNFTENNFQSDLAKTKTYFDKDGRDAYATFLKEKSILKVLQSKRFFIHCFVQDLPLLLNEGPVDGRYRWLFEVPMMLTYMDRSVTSYKEAEPVNQKVLLTLQVGRSPDAKNDQGILIERWSGKIQKLNKK